MNPFTIQQNQLPRHIQHQQSGSVDIDVLSPASSTHNQDSLYPLQNTFSDFNAPPPSSPALHDISFTPSYAAQAGSFNGSPYGSDISFTAGDDFIELDPHQTSSLVDFGPGDLSVGDDYDPAAYDAPADNPSFFGNDFMASLTETAQPAFSPHSHYSPFASPSIGVNVGVTGTSSPSMSQHSSTSSTGRHGPHLSVTPAPDLSPRLGTGLDHSVYIQQPFDHGSPASSAGGDHVANVQVRSRANSISSAHNAQQSSGDFSSGVPQSWPYVTSSQVPQSPPPTSATKPQSPPQLSIPTPEITHTGSPSPTHSTHSNRSENPNTSIANTSSPALLGATLGAGLHPGPGINIEPATPVSGGVNAQAVPFQQTLETLSQGQPTVGTSSPQAQQTTFTPQHHRSHSSPHPQLPQAPPSPYIFAPNPSLSPSPTPVPIGSRGNSVDRDTGTGTLDGGLGSAGYGRHMRSQSQSSPFLSPSTSPAGSALQLGLEQLQDNDFLVPIGTNPRTRSKSDTSLTPPNWQTQGQGQGQMQPQPSFGVNMGEVMGYGTLPQPQQPIVQSISQHGSPIPSHAQLLGPYGSSQPSSSGLVSDFLSPMGFPPSMDLRRAKSDGGMGHRRGARSEDITARRFDSNSLFPPSTAGLGQYLMPGSDLLGLGSMGQTPGAIGAHRRTASGGSHGRSHSRERTGYLSHGASPYPSPHASPRVLPGDLPPDIGLGPFGMGMSVPSNAGPVNVRVMSVGADGRTTVQSQPPISVPRQNVTTNATADASQRRRRTEATFVCPVPGCGSTFTRHFNLKGHLRSHNEERPFKCKWPGCDKGFARQHDCKRHEQLHLNIRPYLCQGCQRTFARMDALNRHLRSDAGTECQTRQPILTSDQPNNPNANSNGNKNGISANGGGSNGIDPSAIEQDVKPWLTNGVTV